MEVIEDKGQMFEPSKNFTDLIVWQKAHEFVLETYKVTRDFPMEERFALCTQFQRAAVSIPANIAEGYKKLSKADKLRFLNISQGSLEECRYYIILSRDLSYINNNTYNELIGSLEETSKIVEFIHKRSAKQAARRVKSLLAFISPEERSDISF